MNTGAVRQSQTKETMEIVTMVIQEVFNSQDFEQKLKAWLDRAKDKKIEEFLGRVKNNSGQIHSIEVAMEASAKERKQIQDNIASPPPRRKSVIGI